MSSARSSRGPASFALQAGVEHAAKNPLAPGTRRSLQRRAMIRVMAARERMLQAAREAIPLLNEAMTAMDQGRRVGFNASS